MIPVERCIGGRELTEPRLSPDGATVALVSRSAAGGAVVLVPAEGGPERQLTASPAPQPGRGTGGGCFDWMPTGDGVVYAGREGDLWLQRVGAVAAEQLTEHGADVPVQSPTISPDGDRVAYTVDLAEVWVASRSSGTWRAERVDGGAHDFVMDPAWSPDGERLAWQAWSVPHMAWDRSTVVVRHLPTGSVEEHHDAGQRQQPRFGPDGTLWYLADDGGWLNLWRDGAPVFDEPFEHGGPSWGPGQRSFAVAPSGSLVAFTRNERGFGRLCVLDLATGEVAELGKGVHAGLHWVGEHLACVRSGARTPTQVVTYRTSAAGVSAAPARTTLAVGPLAGWEAADLSEPELVEARSRDGEELHARLYRPAHTADPPRLLCWVHGGPTDQWQVGFLARQAHWLSRGFSILVPDHRGSTGHGRAYQQALHGRWGELDADDVADVLAGVQRRLGVSPERTALVGSSAGGLTCLGVVARAPELAAACVVLYPVTDLADLAERSHRFERHYTDTLVGTGHDLRDRAAARSPLAHAAAVARRPLLVLHGTDDPVVPVDQSRALVDAVREAGGHVQLVEYEGEGHGFRQPANQLDEYAQLAAFLDQHLR